MNLEEIIESYDKLTQYEKKELMRAWISKEPGVIEALSPMASSVLNQIIKEEEKMEKEKKVTKEKKEPESLEVGEGGKGKPEPIIREAVTSKRELMTLKDFRLIAEDTVKSRFFKEVQNSHQAIALILAGQELGIGPIQAMSKLYIVSGKVSCEAEVMADLIKRNPKYNYRIKELNNERCELVFFEDGKPVGNSVFTIQDAGKANLLGKDVWKKYTRNMLFARAISNGARWYCPDCIHGAYTYEEMGVEVDSGGKRIEATPEITVEGEIVGDTSTKPIREDEVKALVKKYTKKKVVELKEKMEIKESLLKVDDKTFEKFKKELEKKK